MILGAKILQEQIYAYNILLIHDCTYSRLKHTYLIYSKRYLERPSYGVQDKRKGFSSQYFFSSITKKTTVKKLYGEIHSITSQLHGCS